MSMTCSILGCSSRYSKEKNIKFFRFPFKNQCRLTAWLSAINRENWTPSKYDTVCNEHFTASDFLPCREAYNKTYLRPTAVPSIFPLSIKRNKRKKYKVKEIDNENEESEKDNIQENNISCEENLTNIYIGLDNTIYQNINNSHINIQYNYPNIENICTVAGLTEESNIYNVNVNSNLETAAIRETRVTSSSRCVPMKVVINQVNDYDGLDCLKLQRVKNLPTPAEVNLRHKIRMLQQKLRRRDAKIMYLQRLLTHLKQKKDILSVIEHL